MHLNFTVVVPHYVVDIVYYYSLQALSSWVKCLHEARESHCGMSNRAKKVKTISAFPLADFKARAFIVDHLDLGNGTSFLNELLSKRVRR